MKLILLEAATGKEKWSDLVSELYTEKISHFSPMEIISVSSEGKNRSESSVKVKNDSAALAAKLKPDDYVILLDERGESLDSKAWSKLLERVLMSGKRRCVFIIGGAYGVDETLKKRADKSLSLSPMVMNHLVARAVALEQIYRAFTILKNIPYHNN